MSTTRRAAALGLAVLAITGLAACSDDSKDADEASTSTTAGEGRSHTEASAEELEQWQTDLNAVGCWSGPVDGELGPQTEAAIEEFQQAEGLTVDGKLGPETESALQAAVSAGKTVCTASGTTSTTAAGGGTGTTAAGTATVTLTSSAFDQAFTVTSCEPTQGGTKGVVLTGTAPGGGTLAIEAPSGTGTLSITGIPEANGGTLGGDVTSATVSDGAVDVSGTFSVEEGAAFTVTGACA